MNSSTIICPAHRGLKPSTIRRSSAVAKPACFALLLGLFLLSLHGTASAAGKDSLAIATTHAVDSSGTSNHIASPATVNGPDRTALPGVFDMITNLPQDWYHFAKTSITLDHAPVIGAIAVATAGLIVVDNPTWIPFKKAYETSTPVQRLSDALVFMGDGKFQFGLAAVFGAYGIVAPHSENQMRALRTASQTCEVILACGAVVQLLKHVTGRESPIVSTERNGAWQFFPNQIEYAKHVPHYDAFPSGHLATATATLTVIANNYPEVKWIRPAGYVILGAISTALVSTSIHWWSDFPLGFALGYAFGNLISPTPADDSATRATTKDVGDATDPPPSSFASLMHHAVVYPTTLLGSTGIGVTIPF